MPTTVSARAHVLRGAPLTLSFRRAPAFIEYLATLDCSEVKVYAVDEGSAVYARVPLMRVEGPLAICQLLETTLLVLVNYVRIFS